MSSNGDSNDLKLPRPGEILVHDFRPAKAAAARSGKPIRVFQWNIERGYKLASIIDTLRSADADIIALQEVDIACERSECKDVGMEIARALGMKHVFGMCI